MAIYDSLAANYPTQPIAQLYANLGGQWPSLVNDPKYQNTCAIRMSVAFLATGYNIPTKFKEGIAGDGRHIIIKVRTMWDYVTDTFGTFTWGMSKDPGNTVNIPIKKGIIVYHKAFSDATGHFDLWNGSDFIGSGKMSDVVDGYDIAMWYWN